MRVAVTGCRGLVGWHVICALRALGHESVGVDRSHFESEEQLAAVLAGVDAVVHAAGANRGPDDEVFAANIELAERLSRAMRSFGSAPHVVYTNSTHIDRDTPYGASKRGASEIIRESVPAGFTDLILPGIFGEHGRPYYNSVVSTFAHQLANGAALTVNDDASLELVHAQDAADLIIDSIVSRVEGSLRVPGEVTSVEQLAQRMTELASRYDSGVVPAIGDRFERALFNTLRSYRYPARSPIPLDPRADQRGALVEVVKADTGGQSFLSWTKPGITRGNHFHRRKVERFVVVAGTARISLRRLASDEVVHFDVTGDNPVAIDIPTLHTHSITNTGTDMLTTLFWADEIFDVARPDTVFEEV
jgi:UDP-2-acetamido-2,6-beta-L-arabino-hexul-4-ose reductase